jgi:predicted lipoprotein
MRMIHKVAFFTLALSLFGLAFTGCKKEEADEHVDFDRTELLRNYGENLILPTISQLNGSVQQLNNALMTFTAEPTTQNLDAAKSAWRSAYLDFMSVNSFNFGPGGEQGLNKSIAEEAGTWPANTPLIEANISVGNNALNDFNRDNRGFHAIDYLLFAEDETSTLAAFANLNRRAYLLAVSARLTQQITTLNNAWNSGYLSDFISNKGTDVGSSTSLLYNEFVKSFEALKNFKIALPLGLRAGQTQAEPHLVEARYSAQSIHAFRAHYASIIDLWHGRTADGNDGIGWREYLDSVEGGKDLIAATEDQIALIDEALMAISDSPSLEEQITSNFDALNNLHTRLQQHTRYFKSDMSSILGITITFSSGDGD